MSIWEGWCHVKYMLNSGEIEHMWVHGFMQLFEKAGVSYIVCTWGVGFGVSVCVFGSWKVVDVCISNCRGFRMHIWKVWGECVYMCTCVHTCAVWWSSMCWCVRHASIGPCQIIYVTNNSPSQWPPKTQVCFWLTLHILHWLALISYWSSPPWIQM